VTPPASASGRTVLHVDMDAFYVSVELLRHPELRGRPVVVGGSGQRGVVAAASYEARAYGVFSAMSSARARQLCPHAVFLAGDHATYAEVSGRVMDVFRAYTPLVEPLSLDEAFLDVTSVRRLHGDGPRIAAAIRTRVRDEEGLTCSVGVATSKFVAKLASKAAKPVAAADRPRPGPGVVVVEPGTEVAFVQRLDVRELWGVGPATFERLQRLGISTVAQLAAFDRRALVSSLGAASGTHLHQLAHAVDDRPVVPSAPVKSVSHEETYAVDITDRDVLRREIVRQADAVASRLRRAGLRGRTVQLKIRYADFRTISRSATLDDPVDTGPHLARIARSLLDKLDVGPGIRLLGVGVTGLGGEHGQQLRLDEPESGWDDATKAVDRIRDRFGDTAIGPAAVTTADGLKLTRRGAQQWGPGDPEGGTGRRPAEA
jgi:DNA polymerase IV